MYINWYNNYNFNHNSMMTRHEKVNYNTSEGTYFKVKKNIDRRIKKYYEYIFKN